MPFFLSLDESGIDREMKELDVDAQQKRLLELSKAPSLFNGSYREFVRIAVETLSRELSVSRVSFWSYDEKNEKIVNQYLFDLDNNSSSSGEELFKVDFPHYFEAFRTNLIIDAPDARKDLRTCEFTESYLIPNEIHSMLDAQVSVDSKLFGVVCLEQRGHREWTKTDEMLLTATASYVALAYISILKSEEERLRKETEINYRSMFKDSPMPMWVYDRDTLKFFGRERLGNRKLRVFRGRV
jgi:PAS domain-containing protein